MQEALKVIRSLSPSLHPISPQFKSKKQEEKNLQGERRDKSARNSRADYSIPSISLRLFLLSFQSCVWLLIMRCPHFYFTCFSYSKFFFCHSGKAKRMEYTDYKHFYETSSYSTGLSQLREYFFITTIQVDA